MRVLDVLVVVGFAAGISASLLDDWLRPPDERRSVTVEYRVGAPRPTLTFDASSLVRFPTAFDAWYADSFGLRDRLISWNNVTHWLGLRDSPNRAALRGREGWVFTTWGRAIESFCGLYPMTTDELERWRLSLEQRRDFLAERGIRFAYFVVPDKAAVYPDFLPPRLERRGPSRREQFLEYMERHSDVEIVDPLPEILADKAWDTPGDRTYFELGDHWTDRGCLAGYRALLEALGIEPLSREDFVKRPGGQGDNWAERMYMAEYIQQSSYLQVPVRDPGVRRTEGDGDYRSLWVHEDSSLPRVVVFHDSFGVLFIQHLAAHFSETLALWRPRIDFSVVEEFAPDVVVQLYVDRNALVNNRPRVDGDAGRALLERCFEKSSDVSFRAAPPSLEAFRDADVSMSDEAAEIHVRAPAFAYLPEFAFPPGGATLAIDFECEVATPLQLFYRTKDAPEFSREVFLAARTEAGSSRVFFDLSEPRLFGRLLLGFGRPPQTVRILAVEVRAAR